jgi:hypothetical protein
MEITESYFYLCALGLLCGIKLKHREDGDHREMF